MCYYIYTQIHTRSYYLTLLTMLDIPKLLSSKHSEEKKNLIKWRKPQGFQPYKKVYAKGKDRGTK